MFNAQEETILLGIDPGSRVTGYGLIRLGKKIEAVDYGCIRPPQRLSLEKRYQVIFDGVTHLIASYKPSAVIFETQFVYKNVQSALKLGIARGMIMLAAAKNDIPLYEYAPTKAKLAVVGTGAASKHQVQKMVQALLGLSTLPQPEDAADALALAICHANNIPFLHSQKIKRLP